MGTDQSMIRGITNQSLHSLVYRIQPGQFASLTLFFSETGTQYWTLILTYVIAHTSMMPSYILLALKYLLHTIYHNTTFKRVLTTPKIVQEFVTQRLNISPDLQ